MGSSARKRDKAFTMVGFLLLCLLWAADSLRGDLFPPSAVSALPLLERQALRFALLAVAAAAVAGFLRAQWPRGRRLGHCVLVGIGLFLLPALLVHISREWISDLSRVALFSLVPVFALVFEPYFGSGSESLSKSGLIAALGAVVGTLCVFPVDVPESIAAGGAFLVLIGAAACIAAANCGAVSIAADLSGRSLIPRSLLPLVSIMSGTAAAGFALASALAEHPTWNWSALSPEFAWWAAVDWPALLVLFWLMRRMSAVQMTTRFLLAPLIANLVSLLLLRPTVGLRAGLGLLLIAAGAGWLLFRPESENERDSLPPLFVSNE
jgi:drug/metabolite transporter (DMT)-like permease